MQGKNAFDSLGSALENFANSFVQMINQMIAKALAFATVNAILGIGSGGNGLGFGANFVNSLLGKTSSSSVGGGGSSNVSGFNFKAPTLDFGNFGSLQTSSAMNSLIESNNQVVQAINQLNEDNQKITMASKTVIGDNQIRQANLRASFKAKSSVPLPDKR